MPTKTATRPSPRTTQSHSHPPRSKTTSTPTSSNSHVSRAVAASVGNAMPPSLSSLRSPALNQESVRTPSPNYFGLIVDPTSDPRETGLGPKDNWSPPTSSIRSFNAQSPKHIPVDANPDFEAFRRQAEAQSGFNLSHGNLSHFSSTPPPASSRLSSDRKGKKSDIVVEVVGSPRIKQGDGSFDRTEDGAETQGLLASKAQQIAPGTPSFFDIPRQQSPANFTSAAPQAPSLFVQRNVLSRLDDRHPRLSLPSNKVDPPSPHLKQREPISRRADTLPSNLQDSPLMTPATKVKALMDSLSASQYLLLDLRVAPQYAQFRLRNALNLCIPTTLLKRPSFNLEKLTDTFKVEAEKTRFSKWRECKYIIVYDARSVELKDATSAVNTLKKFADAKWEGESFILRGGFAEFSKTYPEWIDNRTSHEMHTSRSQLSLGSSMPDVAPVAGGCEMPATSNAANPFFSNIRQNMDLVGGVGQMDVKYPKDLDQQASEMLPTWLWKASAIENHGKEVSDKFLHIEQDELSRMQQALSSRVSYGTPRQGSDPNVQIAGFEKGGKNRYNNIWPFEHSRVRLQGREESACDYVNASHIKAHWSNKRYIASQGPLPATFEDFWSVIWDHDVRVIVMLTAESEGGQLKCHPYWAAKEYGTFRLKTLSEKRVSLDPHQHRRSSRSQTSEPGRRRANTTTEGSPVAAGEQAEPPYVIVRKFTLSHSSEPFKPMREITQLHYSSWPDFGAPAQPSHLLGLVELSNTLQRAAMAIAGVPSAKADGPEDSENSRPMLVHCSAGCGRTGTFCTVDSVIDMLKRQRKEQRSGITPMEIEPVEQAADYWAKTKDSSRADDMLDHSWIFDQDLDLVEKTVADFRRQRISMVQSLRQYVLCYETVLEWISQQRFSSGRKERSGSEPTS